MDISARDARKYTDQLAAIDTRAGDLMREWVEKNGTGDMQAMADYAYALVQKYGEASAALSAEMYDATAEAQGVTLPPAVPAEPAGYGEVSKTMYGIRKQSLNPESYASGVSRLVKRTGADTTLHNALRDDAEFAWVPFGDTCPFCIALASRGWQKISEKALKNGHAEHIHANCNCDYMTRQDGKSGVKGYDPDKYLAMYEAAEGGSPHEKILSMRRAQYAADPEKYLAPKRAAYAANAGNRTKYYHGYTAEQKKELQELHDNAPKEIRDLYAKYGSQLKEPDGYIDPSIQADAYFNPVDGRVHMDQLRSASGDTWEPPHQVHEHEYAHNIDFLAGKGNGYYSDQYRNASGESFEDVITKDWDKAMRDFYQNTVGDVNGAYQSAFNLQLQPGVDVYGTLRSDLTNWRNINGLSREDPVYLALKNELDHASASVEKMREFYTNHFDVYGALNYNKAEIVKSFSRYIDSNYDEHTKGNLSDLFERYSINAGGAERPFGYGYGKSYALSQNCLAHEAFAEMTASTVTNPGSTALIKQYLPNAYAMYFQMLKGMI